jgi:hypothetical protein
VSFGANFFQHLPAAIIKRKAQVAHSVNLVFGDIIKWNNLGNAPSVVDTLSWLNKMLLRADWLIKIDEII